MVFGLRWKQNTQWSPFLQQHGHEVTTSSNIVNALHLFFSVLIVFHLPDSLRNKWISQPSQQLLETTVVFVCSEFTFVRSKHFFEHSIPSAKMKARTIHAVPPIWALRLTWESQNIIPVITHISQTKEKGSTDPARPQLMPVASSWQRGSEGARPGKINFRNDWLFN